MAANIYQAVKDAMQNLVAPQLESLKGEMVALRAEVSGEVAALRAEVKGDIAALRAEVRGDHLAVTSEIKRLDEKLTWALDLRERISALEARLPPTPARS